MKNLRLKLLALLTITLTPFINIAYGTSLKRPVDVAMNNLSYSLNDYLKIHKSVPEQFDQLSNDPISSKIIEEIKSSNYGNFSIYFVYDKKIKIVMLSQSLILTAIAWESNNAIRYTADDKIAVITHNQQNNVFSRKFLPYSIIEEAILAAGYKDCRDILGVPDLPGVRSQVDNNLLRGLRDKNVILGPNDNDVSDKKYSANGWGADAPFPPKFSWLIFVFLFIVILGVFFLFYSKRSNNTKSS